MFIFRPMWDNPEPIDLICFEMVKTTNQILSTLVQVDLQFSFLFFQDSHVSLAESHGCSEDVFFGMGQNLRIIAIFGVNIHEASIYFRVPRVPQYQGLDS